LEVILRSRSQSVAASRFERRVAPGRHDHVFKVAFGSDAAAARSLGVSKMTVWRWRHDRSPLSDSVSKILNDLLQDKVREAHEAQQEFRYYLQEPPKPPRKLSGCCAGRQRSVGIPAPRLF
jgi:hypothetical protein